jgi:hypothetical protein
MSLLRLREGSSPALINAVAARTQEAARGHFGIVGVVAWVAVGVPFLVGVWIAISKAAALF